ncbi:transglutaminase domain-containing protein [Burkholderia sp. Bp8963]|uniref:transglutaminase domain-containing protein n=1 Tax=Burkholderia sp. Bp8963 TaxID=2184547 RepID=UPI000F596A60|nr:transglutaminase domain-containing protein [Burkholderia sp. Bp8963]RQS70487.1 transglutaminase domain-containing protein [Burkholderia sp. Bp8963]
MNTAITRDWATFSRQTVVSDPGAHAARATVASLAPSDLVECIGRTVLNFVTDRTLVDSALFASRLWQVDLRTTEAMLDALFAISETSLSAPRRPDERIVGNCRDTALLCASVLRTYAVPARVRYGFAHRLYRPHARMHEHAVTEFFDGQRWQTIDCRMHGEVIALHDIDLVPGQLLPDGLFVPALTLWHQCRSGERDFATFGGPHGGLGRGMSAVAKYAYLDIASLNGFEPLMWDVWGPALFRHPEAVIDDEEELEALDRCACLNPDEPGEWARLRDVYESSDVLRVPGVVTSFSPQAGVRRWPLPTHES